MRPIIKWVGNKNQILEEIENNISKTDKYFEPFVGGGSVFFDLCEKMSYSYTCISDINDKLMDTYYIIKERPNDLIDEIKKLKENYDNKNFRTQKGIYYRTRDSFNKSTDKLEIASKFLFLNKTCYSGLYRTDNSGNFNTGFLRTLTIDFNYEEILKASKLLKNTDIYCCDYKKIIKCVDKNSFVFLDPPYYNSFNNYYKNSFDGNNIEELFDFCCKIDNIGAKFLLCNVRSQKIKRTFGEEFEIETIKIERRMKNRKIINEFLIYNG